MSAMLWYGIGMVWCMMAYMCIIEGRLFTTGPYDLFFMINGQVDICLEKFRLRNKVYHSNISYHII